MRPVCVIPARGGSKRIPRKNLEVIGDYSAVEHAVINALKSNLFDQVIISTDDAEIAEAAAKQGATFESFRPESLSGDYATTLDVMAFEVEKAKAKFTNNRLFCCIYPMTPLLDYSHVAAGKTILENSEYDYVFSAIKGNLPIQRALIRTAEQGIKMLYGENESVRTQDLEEHYFDAGQFYWGQERAWTAKRPILGGNSNIVVLDKYEVIDVDDPQDLQMIRELYKMRNQEER